MHEASLAGVARQLRQPSSAPKLTYHDLCQPTALLQHPDAFHRFWAGSTRTYREATPHGGYAMLERLCASKPSGCTCVYTSNVDGLFRRFPTLRANLHEIHGCVGSALTR